MKLSQSEIEQCFFNHCAESGVIFTERPLLADGRLHRAHVEGDKRGTKNGAYILHLDGKPSGWYMHFKTGITGRWSLSSKREPMTTAMLKQIEQAKQQRQAEQAERHRSAADKSKLIWSRSKPIDNQDQHPYLIKKRIKPYGLRLNRDGSALVVPMYSANKELINLQFIDTQGNKRFLSGGQKKGCFSVIGNHQDGQPVVICEGWATGASLHESTGNFVVVAMDAGNLEPVAKAIRSLDADAEIIIAGDNDISGKGQMEAKKAALAICGKYIIPATPGHDWNDFLTGMA